MSRLGVHVTISPTPLAGLEEAKALGVNCIQIFTHNPRGWNFKPLDTELLKKFRSVAQERDIKPIVSHCNYLINLAAVDKEKWEKSLACMKKEFVYAKEFGCDYFVLHVGKHLGAGLDAGIGQVAKGINAAKKEILASDVMLLLETVAGQGTEVGVDFKDLNRIIDRVDTNLQKMIGVCMDTCHAYAAGYDIKTKKGIDETIKAIKDSFGLARLKVIHVNDSKGELGGHLDRHAHIGEGTIGTEGFADFLNRSEIRTIPLILETPIDEVKGYPENLKALRALRKADK